MGNGLGELDQIVRRIHGNPQYQGTVAEQYFILTALEAGAQMHEAEARQGRPNRNFRQSEQFSEESYCRSWELVASLLVDPPSAYDDLGERLEKIGTSFDSRNQLRTHEEGPIEPAKIRPYIGRILNTFYDDDEHPVVRAVDLAGGFLLAQPLARRNHQLTHLVLNAALRANQYPAAQVSWHDYTAYTGILTRAATERLPDIGKQDHCRQAAVSYIASRMLRTALFIEDRLIEKKGGAKSLYQLVEPILPEARV